MKKVTYHSNSRYNVCTRVIAEDQELREKYITIKGQMLTIRDDSEKFTDNYNFNFNKIFQ